MKSKILTFNLLVFLRNFWHRSHFKQTLFLSVPLTVLKFCILIFPLYLAEKCFGTAFSFEQNINDELTFPVGSSTNCSARKLSYGAFMMPQQGSGHTNF